MKIVENRMKNLLKKMIEQLSEEDKLLFSELAEKLNKVDGDISKLSKNEFELIAKMEAKYADKLGAFKEQSIEENKSKDLLESGFATHARQLLARDLNTQFPNEEDAVKFAFQNKWIPAEFREAKTAQVVFENYQQDISEANQWRDEVVGVESDKIMAVGLTWFMVIYQLNERLN